MTTAYNFHCDNPLMAAQIASLRTADIQDIFKACFSVTVNIMQKFPKPPKCKAAEYIVDNAPSSLLRNHLAQHLAEYQRIANGGAGRPVNKYRHDPNHNNDAWRGGNNTNSAQAVAARSAADTAVQVEAVPDNAMREVQQIIEDANSDSASSQVETDTDAADNLAKALADLLASGNMLDENKVREIARQEDSKVAEHIQRTISEAVAAINAPTRVHIVSRENDGSEAVRDMGVQHHNFPRLLAYCQQRDRSGCRPNIWLPGPAGSGKTTAAENIAVCLGVEYGYMGALMDKTEAFGYMDAHGNYVETEFYRRWKNGGVFLWDESDGSDPMQAVCMNAALAGKWAAFPCGMVRRHEDFIFIAAANTYGNGADGKYVGRNMLDKATLDRFIKLPWDYDAALEAMIIGHDGWLETLRKARASAQRCGLDIVVSTRAGQRCVMLEAAGMDTRDEIIETVFRDGLTDDQWHQFKRGII